MWVGGVFGLQPKADVVLPPPLLPPLRLRLPPTHTPSRQPTDADALQVKSLLSKAEDVDAIIQAVPELSDPVALSRSLSFLASSFPGKDPVLLLQVGWGGV